MRKIPVGTFLGFVWLAACVSEGNRAEDLGDATGMETGASDGDGDDDGDTEDGGGGDGDDVKYDVGDGSTGGPGDSQTYCTGVDVLFVIDNSGSMSAYQDALALAFPAFADTLVATLPPDTDLHVGVTSTEMEYTNDGNTAIENDGSCTFFGEGNRPSDSFYLTPDVENSGRNGAQGRLFDPGGGQYFYEVSSSAPPAEIEGLKDWFADAATIGEGGSNIEMSTAPVGWVADPANDATNAGFIRDEGTVMVVFFVQDEPDQTPKTIDGQSGGIAMLDRLAAAKAACGGRKCILGGGFLDLSRCRGNGTHMPIDDFLDGLETPPVVGPLPASNDPAAAAAEMNATLGDTLAGVIAQLCDEIPPQG